MLLGAELPHFFCVDIYVKGGTLVINQFTLLLYLFGITLLFPSVTNTLITQPFTSVFLLYNFPPEVFLWLLFSPNGIFTLGLKRKRKCIRNVNLKWFKTVFHTVPEMKL